MRLSPLLIRRGGSTNNRSRVAAHLQDLYAALLIRRGGSTKAPIIEAAMIMGKTLEEELPE